MSFTIRNAREADAEALLKIYAPYVENTAITFEYDVPTVTEFENRIRTISEDHPYIVLEDENGNILGYSYASPLKTRAAYAPSVETTIYIDERYRGKGFGKELYRELEERLIEKGFTNAYACIAYARPENTRLDNASMHFHEAMGYKLNGTFHKCATKFGEWYDMIWMEKILKEH